MKKTLKLIFILFLVLFSVSCATVVTVERERPAELNLNGANTISVLPIQTSMFDSRNRYDFLGFYRHNWDRRDPKQEIASYITEELQNRLIKSDYLTLIDSKRVEMAIENDNEIPCDVYLSGYITNWEDEVKTNRHVNDDDEVSYTYERRIKFTFVYQILDSETGEIISNKHTDIVTTSSRYKDKTDIPTPLEIVKYGGSSLETLIPRIMNELTPHIERIGLVLMKDKTKDPDFAEADQCAKNGDFETALELFTTIYKKNESFESGYNAAIMLRALGEFEEAEEMMRDVYQKTNNKKALSAINDIKRDRDLEKKFQAQQEQQESRK